MKVSRNVKDVVSIISEGWKEAEVARLPEVAAAVDASPFP